MPEFTPRQQIAWVAALKEIEVRCEITLPEDPYAWLIQWQDEVRTGRGQDLDATIVYEDFFVQVSIDVYGHYNASVAHLEWLHSNTYEEDCPCGHTEEEDE